ncbi:hypothetical protein LU293_01690 [Moraxella nasovis]|uniref:hypothetical protein n=1 Tax=Moraxella nasovis TaxID=2904121 RepID=UPI001F603B7A|nr:hypothetical protein [Moraxella nasovis]UNU73650.1 hypothetical protein LU293_01690 [Moraxella nasovis]
MNIIQKTTAKREFISLAKINECLQNSVLSQKCKAVRHTAQTGFFIAYSQGKPTISNAFWCYSLMVWLILQNKPFGEYVERLLYIPRVRPHHPFAGLLLKNCKGAYSMNTSILNHSLTVLTDEYHRYNERHAQNPYQGYCERANAIYNAIHALKSLNNAPFATYAPPKPKSTLKRILGVFKGGAK